MTKTEAINKMINIAKAEIGYLEKRSNANLDSMTGNAGSGNYTKYWRDVYPSYQGQAWCACFVSWVLMQAFGLDKARKLLKHWPYVYCPTLSDLFTWYANPETGDIVIFYRSGRFSHTGIVTKVSGDKFWTVEGNTSGASGIVSNGGGVCAKSYYNSKLIGTKFCRLDWSIVAESNSTPAAPTPTASSTGKRDIIAAGQIHGKNFTGYVVKFDGDRGPETRKLAAMVLQNAMNLDYKVGLAMDGDFGTNSKAALRGHTVRMGETQYMVTALEILLMLTGYDPKGVESPGEFGSGLKAAVKKYQSDHGLEVDGIAGYNTFLSLLK